MKHVLILFLGLTFVGQHTISAKKTALYEPNSQKSTAKPNIPNNTFQDLAILDLLLTNIKLDPKTFHVFSHGRPGQLLIQGRWLGATEIADFLRQNKQADGFERISIYGCEFGKGTKGREAVAYLEKSLSVSISASDDITGKDGDWDLEVGEPEILTGLEGYSGNLQYAATDDFDGDGVLNQNDIDDDNDGVPDAVESPTCYYKPSDWNTGTKPANAVVITSALTTTTSNFSQLTDGVSNVNAVTFSNSPAQAIQNANVYLFTFAHPVVLDALYLKFNTVTQFANTTKIQGSNTNNGSDWVDLSAAIAQTAATNTTVDGSVSVTTSIKYPVTLNTTTAYKYIRITGAVASNIAAQNASEVYFDFDVASYVASLYPKPTCTDGNIDGDGILPHFDLDSDGDGCSDAFESGATSSQTVNYQFPDVDANNDGLVDAVDTNNDGIVGYTSTYNQYAIHSELASCKDSDNDGVFDVVDLDDDNDGVLDLMELGECDIVTYPDGDKRLVWDFEQELHTLVNNVEYVSAQTQDNSNRTFGPGIVDVSGANVFRFTGATEASFNAAIANGDYMQWYFTTSTASLSASKIANFTIGPAGLKQGLIISKDPNFGSYVVLDDGSIPYSDNSAWMYNYLNNYPNYPLDPNTTYYLRYVYWGLTGSTTALCDAVGITFNGFSNPGTCGKDIDTDSDGIPNRLDLDSDADGCPDLVEGRVNSNPGTTGHLFASGGGNYSGGIAPGTPNAYLGMPNATPSQYGANGFFNGIETSSESGVYNGSGGYFYHYATSSFINRCTDHDGDGIDDVNDIDDDNDGVPDAIESPSCYYTANEWNTAAIPDYTVAVTSGLTTTVGHFDELVNTVGNVTAVTFSASPTQAIQNANVYLFTFVNPIRLSALYLEFNTATQFAGTTKIQGSNTNNGSDWVDLSAAISQTAGTNVTVNGSVSIPNSIKYPITLNSTTAYKYIRITGVAASNILAQNASEVYFDVNASYYIPSLYPKENCTNDTDGDGIINQWDLNSDNDACSDASEAGATTISSAVYQFPDIDVNDDGLVDAVDSDGDGRENYISTYNFYAIASTITICTNTDGDLVNDIVGLDDDNDGILDAVESPSCFYTALEMAVPSSVTTEIPTAGVTTNLNDNNSSTTFAFTSTNTTNALNKTIFEITPKLPQVVTSIVLNLNTANSPIGVLSASATLKAQGWNGYNWVDLATYSSNPSISANTQTFAFSSNNIAYTKYRLYESGTSGVAIGTQALQELKLGLPSGYVASANPKLGVNCSQDLDSDNIPNHHDLDSDGDGCSDAIEGGTNMSSDPITTSDLSLSSLPGGNSGTGYTGAAGPVIYNLGNSTDGNGVPNSVSGGQVLGSSQNAAVKNADCTPPPVAVPDQTINHSPGQPVNINISSNDTGGDPVNPSTVNLIASGSGSCIDTDSDQDCDKLTVPGEGIWIVSSAGLITFTPENDFTVDPTPITYTVKGMGGGTSSPVQVLIDNVPLATDDTESETTGNPATVNTVINDVNGDNVDPTTVIFTATSSAAALIKPGEGTWTINSTTGQITFTPESGFTGDPTPITYTVEDFQGNISNVATVSVFYSMPVTLVSFLAKESVEGTKLIWKTSVETNFDYFEIEQSTRLKTGFSKLGEVKGGYSDYTFIDAEKRNDVSYYRLKMVDLDGSFTYSHIVSIQTEGGIEPNKVFPNPSQGLKFYVKSPVPIESYKIYDVTGREVSAQMKVENGKVEFQLDRKTPSGVYIIVYKAGDAVISEKFVLTY